MRLWAEPFGAINRFFRSKGFGIHSPFAFSFVREVLFQPYSYYAYDELENATAGRSRLKDVDLKRLFRVILHFSPCEVVNDYDDSAVSLTVSLAMTASIRKNRYKLRIVPPDSSGSDLLDEDIIVWLDSRKSRTSLLRMASRFDEEGSGMMFIGDRLSIAVRLSSLSRQDFSLSI